MSNDLVRVTFPDGRQLYTVGDNSDVQLMRLYETEDEAWAVYRADKTEVFPPVYSTVKRGEYEAARATEVRVRMETRYGSRDYSYRPMQAYWCFASYEARIITKGPHTMSPEEESAAYGI